MEIPVQTSRQPTRFGRWASFLLAACVWGYLAALLLVWGLLRFGGDRWWPASYLLFGPRIVFAAPLVVLVPAVALWNWRLWRPVAAAAVLLLFPLMGLCVPWQAIAMADGPPLTVLACNIHGRRHDPAALAKLIEDVRPDVVALEECAGVKHLAGLDGMHVVRKGELTIASRWPLRLVDVIVDRIPQHKWPRAILLACTAETPHGPLSFCAVHLSSPRYGLYHPLNRETIIRPSQTGLLIKETAERQKQAEHVAAFVARLPNPVIIAGDFNMPVESRIYRDCWSRWRNAFSMAGWGFGHTVWQPVGPLASSQRIDHILCGPELRPARCWVGPDINSDHRPVIAELRWRSMTTDGDP